MMTPLLFEQTYQAEWAELEASLAVLAGRDAGATIAAVSGARVAASAARASTSLAPGTLVSSVYVDRLERMTAEAHQVIYHRREVGSGPHTKTAGARFPRRSAIISVTSPRRGDIRDADAGRRLAGARGRSSSCRW